MKCLFVQSTSRPLDPSRRSLAEYWKDRPFWRQVPSANRITWRKFGSANATAWTTASRRALSNAPLRSRKPQRSFSNIRTPWIRILWQMQLPKTFQSLLAPRQTLHPGKPLTPVASSLSVGGRSACVVFCVKHLDRRLRRRHLCDQNPQWSAFSLAEISNPALNPRFTICPF